MKSGKRMLEIGEYKGEGEEVKKRNSKSNLLEKMSYWNTILCMIIKLL